MAQTSMTALATFSRSLRPRAQLLVRLQMGATAEADRCEAEAWADFEAIAAQHPIGQWPLRYWNRLLRSPALAEADIEHLPTALQPLPPTERAAWLLRHIAHLDEAHAAGCLDIPAIRYAEALRRAESLLVAGGYHVQKMQRLRAQWLAALDPHTAAAEPKVDRGQITREREVPLDPALTHAEPSPPPAARRRSWRWLSLLMLIAVSGGLMWWWMQHPAETPQPAPVAPVPASEAALTVLHPDYDLLRDTDAAALAGRMDRLSWWSVSAATSNPSLTAPDTSTRTLALPEASAPERFDALPSKERELLASIALSWEALDATQRARLHANARHWLAMDEAARNAVLRTRQDWDNSPRVEREAKRQRLLLWRALNDGERGLLRDAARRWQELRIEDQQQAEAAFLALDAAQREAWWLGPSLGHQFPALAPLFEFAPPTDRERLLSALRVMPPAERDALAQRLAGSTPSERERLRAALLR